MKKYKITFKYTEISYNHSVIVIAASWSEACEKGLKTINAVDDPHIVSVFGEILES